MCDINLGASSTHLHALNENSRKLMGKELRYICLSGTGLTHSAFSTHPNHRDLLLKFAKKLNREQEAIKDMLKLMQSVDLHTLLEGIAALSMSTEMLETVWSPVIESKMHF